MRLLYFDCQSGIGGDMAVGALLDLGADLHMLAAELSKLKLPMVYDIEAEKTMKNGIAATAFRVFSEENGELCSSEQMSEWILYSGLKETVKDKALKTLRLLIRARTAVHGAEGKRFRLDDAISCVVQTVSSTAGIDCLGADAVISSPLTEGSGFAETRGGFVRLPVPTVMEIAREAGAPFEICGESTQLVTETGAAIVCAAAQRFAPMPSVTVEAVGFGAGMKDLDTRANVLRVILGDNRYAFFGENLRLAESAFSFGEAFGYHGTENRERRTRSACE